MLRDYALSLLGKMVTAGTVEPSLADSLKDVDPRIILEMARKQAPMGSDR